MATFTNQATLSYNGNTVNSNTVTGNIVEVLDAEKTAVSDSYTANEDVTYIISLTNSGTLPLTGLTVTDDLGAYTVDTATVTPLSYVADSVVYFQNGVLQTAPTVTAGPPLTFTGISVPAGGNAIIVYEARTNNFAPLQAQSTITNTVTVTGGGLTTPVTADEVITATDEAVLTITKALDPVNVPENGQLTYTFTIQNTGNTAADAGDNIVITDTFNPILENLTVEVNGVALPTSSYTYDQDTGLFTTNAGAITVPAATITQDSVTGEVTVTPGITTVTVTGTV